MGLLALFLLLCLLSVSFINGSYDPKVFTVEKGSHDFKPNDFPFPLIGVDSYSGFVSFDKTCWWSIEDDDYKYGNDIYDWNKIGGFTHYFSANNNNAALFGWRPSPLYNKIEITAYTNIGKTFKTGEVVTVPVDSLVFLDLQWERDSVLYYYADGRHSELIKKPKVLRKVGSWFGGNRESHGRKSLTLRVIVK